jgi:trehalose 6-phosphate phosphatase|nr:trehalose-phosphatase [Gammaproteobacteria bacterium]
MSLPSCGGQVDVARAMPCEASASALLAEWLSSSWQACSLFLDVDGTLLDIAETPDAVRVPPELLAALATLQRRLGGALALVSGRSLDSLDALFAPLRLAASGGHGAQWRQLADEAPRHASNALDAALRERLAVLAQRHPGVLAEDKGSSFALHYRAVPEVAPALAAALDELLAGPLGRGLRLLPGKMVFEVIGRGCDKGLAIRRFLAAPPFRGRWPLFIGDDVTDEAALAVVAELGGLGLSVGRALPGARAVFADAAALRAALVEAAGGLAR